MKMVKRLFMIFVMNLVYVNLSAQEPCDSASWAKPGTYEVVTIPGSVEGTTLSKTIIPNVTLCEIEKLRSETKIVEYTLNYCTLIRIYPKTSLLSNPLNVIQK